MKNKKTKDRWEYLFPLWDSFATKQSVLHFWNQQTFDLKIPSQHGNCDFCFLKGLKKKVAQAHFMPERLQWWIDMENKIGSRFHKDFEMKTLKQLALNPQLFDEPNIDCFCGD